MSEYITLDNLKIGSSAQVIKLNNRADMKRRLMDIGLTPRTFVKCVLKSPLGDPKAYLIRGAVIAIRNDDSKDVYVKTQKGGE